MVKSRPRLQFEQDDGARRELVNHVPHDSVIRLRYDGDAVCRVEGADERIAVPRVGGRVLNREDLGNVALFDAPNRQSSGHGGQSRSFIRKFPFM